MIKNAGVSPLCSTHDQVFYSTEIKEVTEKHLSPALSDWFLLNDYPEEAEKILECAKRVMLFQCSNGHFAYYRLHCGREYCSICGKKGSWLHKRRIARAVRHFAFSILWGNLTFTIPRNLSESLLSKHHIAILERIAWEITKNNLSTDGAMIVPHLFGEQDSRLHVHFEVLFMITGASGKGKIAQEVLENIKKTWALKLNEVFKLDLQTTDVRYNFITKKAKKWHKLNYILRPIATEEKMLAADDEVKRYVLGLKGMHRIKYFGCLSNKLVNQWLCGQGVSIKVRAIPMIERKVCPICKQKMKFVECVFVNEIFKSQVKRYNYDIWIDLEIATYLEEQKDIALK